MSLAVSHEIIYPIDDADAVCMVTYDVRVTFSKYDGYGDSWSGPGEPDHVADIEIAEVIRVRVEDESFVPKGKKILERLRLKYGDCEAIASECHRSAFGCRE